MERRRLKDLAGHIQAGLWMTICLLLIPTLALKSMLFQRIMAGAMIVLALHLVGAYLYLKKPLGLKGISDKSKISIVATFIMATALTAVAFALWFLVTLY